MQRLAFAAAVAGALATTVMNNGAAASPLVDAAEIDGQRLTLTAHEDGCTLITGVDGTVGRPVAIPAPCSFHRDGNGAVRVMLRDRNAILLIQSSRPHGELPGDCETFVRAVAVGDGDGDVALSPHTSRLAACPPFHWDDVLFYGLFDR